MENTGISCNDTSKSEKGVAANRQVTRSSLALLYYNDVGGVDTMTSSNGSAERYAEEMKTETNVVVTVRAESVGGSRDVEGPPSPLSSGLDRMPTVSGRGSKTVG